MYYYDLGNKYIYLQVSERERKMDLVTKEIPTQQCLDFDQATWPRGVAEWLNEFFFNFAIFPILFGSQFLGIRTERNP